MKTVIARMVPVVFCVPCGKKGFDLLQASAADVDFYKPRGCDDCSFSQSAGNGRFQDRRPDAEVFA